MAGNRLETCRQPLRLRRRLIYRNNDLVVRGAGSELIARRSHEGLTGEPGALSAALDVFAHATMRNGQRAYADTEGDNRPIPEIPSRSLSNEIRMSQRPLLAEDCIVRIGYARQIKTS